uniref:Apple domain-containing protein n=1 Tax=Magallana gigas TaxID=29159 RepID=K1PMX4_MAGGI
MVHLLISKYLNEVTFTTVLLCVVSLYEGVTSAVVPGERYRGPVVRVLEIIGQKQCVRECRHRPKLCRGVNYRKQELLCELVSAIDKTETNPDYVRIKLNQGLLFPDKGSETMIAGNGNPTNLNNRDIVVVHICLCF